MGQLDWGQFNRLIQNIKTLGAPRIAVLAAIGVLVSGFVFAASYLATRSGYETIYVGLTQQDITRMGAVLAEAGIAFEASVDGSKLLVPFGQAGEARARLAEKGLPGSATAGYELFDKLGALGLTSFMQQVTKVRALEGELSRTIQNLKGVKAARVHIVLPESGSLRLNRQAPAASVVIKTEVQGDVSSASAIRHLVAAAIPEMTASQVSVIGTDGTVMASGSDGASELPSKTVELERSISRQLQDNVRRTLNPYLGLENFEVSASVRLNLDKRQTNETAFDPDKRVERSVRVVKEAQTGQEASTRGAVSVEQNVPSESGGASGSGQTKHAQDRKEETTNYEVGSKLTSTTSEGYRIEVISLAIVVNKKRLADMLGKEPTQEDLTREVGEIEKLASSAAGADQKRGDRVSVAAVTFAPVTNISEGESAGRWTSVLLSLAAGLIKSLTMIAVGIIVVWGGFKPLTRALLSQSQNAEAALGLGSQKEPDYGRATGFEIPQLPLASSGAIGNQNSNSISEVDQGPIGTPRLDPKRQLEEIFSADEERSMAVIRNWVRAN